MSGRAGCDKVAEAVRYACHYCNNDVGRLLRCVDDTGAQMTCGGRLMAILERERRLDRVTETMGKGASLPEPFCLHLSPLDKTFDAWCGKCRKSVSLGPIQLLERDLRSSRIGAAAHPLRIRVSRRPRK